MGRLGGAAQPLERLGDQRRQAADPLFEMLARQGLHARHIHGDGRDRATLARLVDMGRREIIGDVARQRRLAVQTACPQQEAFAIAIEHDVDGARDQVVLGFEMGVKAAVRQALALHQGNDRQAVRPFLAKHDGGFGQQTNARPLLVFGIVTHGGL